MTADLLRRAANRVEQLAADCRLGDTSEYQHLCAWLMRGTTVPKAAAHWWAVMGPQVATPIVDLLRSAADDLDATTRNLWGHLTPEEVAARAEQEWFRRPLALARVILGEHP